MFTKILSVLGILFSFSGVLMTLYIFFQIENFTSAYFNLYYDKNENLFQIFSDLDAEYLMTIQKDIVTPLVIFFLFFLFVSVRQIFIKR